ncbi:MAG: dTMP kinase [Firmicutes bacterium]|nr:dTMP kinase [Bacillota bacterium]
MRGIFITVEGGDGAGKSTQLANIKQYMEDRSISAIFTREPGGTEIAEKIREIILDPENEGMEPLTEALLYAASRAEHVRKVIAPALEDGLAVVCDRFLDSSIAYQGYGRGLGKVVEMINEPAVAGYIPDLTILLDLEPEVAMARISNRGHDRLETESQDFHERVHQGYLDMIAKDEESGISRIARIPADRLASDIKSDIYAALNQIFGEAE